jgi:hypothetical protein
MKTFQDEDKQITKSFKGGSLEAVSKQYCIVVRERNRESAIISTSAYLCDDIKDPYIL